MPLILPPEPVYEQPPAGSHTATCFRVVDLGTQPGKYGPRPQVLFSWDLPDELMTDQRPFVISRVYGLSSDPRSNLLADVEGSLGRTLAPSEFGKFDLSTLLGTTCLIGIKHQARENGKVYANVTSIMRKPKAIAERMSPANPVVGFSLADRPFRQLEYEELPSWVRDKIARSPEYAAAVAPQQEVSAAVKQRLKSILADKPEPAKKPEPPLDDEIPFE